METNCNQQYRQRRKKQLMNHNKKSRQNHIRRGFCLTQSSTWRQHVLDVTKIPSFTVRVTGNRFSPFWRL